MLGGDYSSFLGYTGSQGYPGSQLASESYVTTVTASGIGFAGDHDTASFVKFLSSQGLAGTYDLVHVPMNKHTCGNCGFAVINFIDPAFVHLFVWVITQECQCQIIVAPAEIQGLEPNRKYWSTALRFEAIAEEDVGSLGFRPSNMPPGRVFVMAVAPDSWAESAGVQVDDELLEVNGRVVAKMTEDGLLGLKSDRPLRLVFARGTDSEPIMPRNPVPSLWAINTVNSMLAPRMDGQFHKTKMCSFQLKGRCEMGPRCQFAHSEMELMPMPDLVKTKLCSSHFRARCKDPACKFAHGSGELRADWLSGWPSQTCLYFDVASMGMQPCIDSNGYPTEIAGFLGVAATASSTFGMLTDARGNERQQDELYSISSFVAKASSSQDEVQVKPAPPAEKETKETKEGTGTGSTSHSGRGRASSSCDTPASSAAPTLWQSASKVLPATPLPNLGRNVVLYQCGTFMEALEIREDNDDEPYACLQRSWSDSDLPLYKEAMAMGSSHWG